MTSLRAELYQNTAKDELSLGPPNPVVCCKKYDCRPFQRFHNSAEIDKSVNRKMSQHTFYNHMDAVTLYCDLDPDPSTASWKAIRFFCLKLHPIITMSKQPTLSGTQSRRGMQFSGGKFTED